MGMKSGVQYHNSSTCHNTPNNLHAQGYSSKGKMDLKVSQQQPQPKNLSRQFANIMQGGFKDVGVNNKISEAVIEDRFSKTHTQPLLWYDQRRILDSPYRDGGKNLRYASPNFVSNAVFYDQTSNLSLEKKDMYKTSTQSFYTPPKSQIRAKIPKNDVLITQKYEPEPMHNTIDFRSNTGYYSPSKHMMDREIMCPRSAKKSSRSVMDDDWKSHKSTRSRKTNKSAIGRKSHANGVAGLPPRYVSSNRKQSDMSVVDMQSVVSKSDMESTLINVKHKKHKSDVSDMMSAHSYSSYRNNWEKNSSYSGNINNHLQISSRHQKDHLKHTKAGSQRNIKQSNTKSGKKTKQKTNVENMDPSMRFDYPPTDSKKHNHDLLKHLRNTKDAAKKLSINKQRLLTKADHFADLLTGDPQKKLHDQRNKARVHNQKLLMNLYQSYEHQANKGKYQQQYAIFPSIRW